jgi:hypothetical protein
MSGMPFRVFVGLVFSALVLAFFAALMVVSSQNPQSVAGRQLLIYGER